jgi:hypothetical protein
MKKEYLPSRQFIIRVVILAVIALGAFSVYKIVHYFKNRSADKAPTKLVVKDIIQKDSNKNGIPDWEESLWGLDPAKDGASNKEFILAERAKLAKDEERSLTNDGEGPATENETLSREFFAIIMSLQQSGELDGPALKGVSDAIGENITATPIADVYTKSMLRVKEGEDDDTLAVIEYYTDYIELNNKYSNKDIGNELTFIAQGVENEDAQALAVAGTVASSYKAFGKDLMKIVVPESLVPIHLRLANDYEKTGQSIGEILKVLTDPIAGMKGLVNYNKYSNALVDDIGELSDNFN